MRARFGILLTVVLLAAALAGCGSDSDSDAASTSASEAKGAPSATFRPKDALLTPADLPGYTEVESSPGDGICDFRLVDRAANGSRITFQSSAESALIEQLVMLFGDDAQESLDAFVEAVKGCATGTTGEYTLTYAIVPVKGVDAEQVVGVEAVSTAGSPAITSLTIVAREGEEIVSVAAVATDGSPDALARRTVKLALKRLQVAREKAS